MLSQRSKTEKEAEAEEREAVQELEDPSRQRRGGGARERVDDWFDVDAVGDAAHRMSASDDEVEPDIVPARGRGRGRGTGN